MLLKMTEEPDDYEGPWPKGDAMTEWVMVPREPTEQMLVALANTPCRVGWPAKAYRAMLDAAPAAPQQAETVAWRRLSGFNIIPPLYVYRDAPRDDEPDKWEPLYLHPPAAPQQAEPVAWRDHVEQRLHNWRQRTMNRSGDRLALDDMMSKESIDDLIDYVCDEWSDPVAPQQAEPAAWMAFGGSIVHAVTRNAMDPIEAERFDVPLYLHPPAAEVQRLRDAALALLNELDAGRHGAQEFNNLRNALRGE